VASGRKDQHKPIEAKDVDGFVQTDEICIVVCGELIEADLKSQIDIGDVSTDMKRVGSQINYWGGILAAARAERSQIDAMYRRWRARQVNAILAAEKSLAEWKVNARVNAMDTFMSYKNADAIAERNVIRLEHVVKSFTTKANQLPSEGSHKRDEWRAHGMNTKVSPEPPSKKTTGDEREARKNRVREKISNKKRGKGKDGEK
jgi:hypothetical protein